MAKATLIYVVFVGAMLTCVQATLGEITIPDPGTYVVDQADIIDAATERKLEGWLRELQQKTGAQIKILTVATLDGEPAFDFFLRHSESWKLGSAEEDNGALIGVAVKERKIRILPGYGLEPILPDGWCGEVIREVYLPRFKTGDFSGGILLGTIALANRVADSANIKLSGIPEYRYQGRGRRGGRYACGGTAPFIILMIVVSSMSRRRRHRGTWGGGGMMRGLLVGSVLSSMMGGGRHSSWGGGGGFGGGGFGGGSFGGGGGFGGGGAGGSW